MHDSDHRPPTTNKINEERAVRGRRGRQEKAVASFDCERAKYSQQCQQAYVLAELRAKFSIAVDKIVINSLANHKRCRLIWMNGKNTKSTISINVR